jgi:hypothetical protein
LHTGTPVSPAVRTARPARCECSRSLSPKGARRNNSNVSHLTCSTSSASARPHSRNPQRRQGYACGFVRSGEPNLWHS